MLRRPTEEPRDGPRSHTRSPPMAEPKKPATTPAQARKAAADLLDYWRAGNRSSGRVRRRSQKDGRYHVYGQKARVLAGEARREKMPADTLKKAWRVAEQYIEEDIQQWCALIRTERSRFGPTHLLRLLAVEDRTRRDELTRTAITSKWGVAELERAIQAVNGRRDGVGKRPKIPGPRRQKMASLVGLCVKWERWCAAAGAGLPDEIDEVLADALAAVGRVRGAAETYLPASPQARKARQGAK